MPNILDGMAVLLPVNIKESCPICGKSLDQCSTKKENEDKKKGCLKSIPANLGCKSLPRDPTLPNYTTAAHHLIPANQCLKKFPRLSQMCKAAGYDVNNKGNGLALPTCAQADLNQYETESGKMKKYGNLSDNQKENVAFTIMKGLNLQWHVGHHNWKKKKVDLDTDDYPHVENYDKLVKMKLRNIERKFAKDGDDICNPPDDSEKGDKLIKDMNALSSKIKGQVVGWTKFFVSALAEKYSRECR